jgi:hypothetical protein
MAITNPPELIDWIDKVNNPEIEALLAQYPEYSKIGADEINMIKTYLNYLLLNSNSASFTEVTSLPVLPELNKIYRFNNRFVFFNGNNWEFMTPRYFQKQFSRYSLGVTSNNYFGTQNTATTFQAIQNLNTSNVGAIGWSRNTGIMRIPFKCRLISIAMQRPFSGTVNVAIAKSSNAMGGPEGVDAVLVGNYDIDNTIVSNLNLSFLSGDYFHLAQKFIPTPAGTVYINDLTFIFEEVL